MEGVGFLCRLKATVSADAKSMSDGIASTILRNTSWIDFWTEPDPERNSETIFVLRQTTFEPSGEKKVKMFRLTEDEGNAVRVFLNKKMYPEGKWRR